MYRRYVYIRKDKKKYVDFNPFYMNYKWVYFHDCTGVSDNMVRLIMREITMPVCSNPLHDFTKDFPRMKLHINNRACSSPVEIMHLLEKIKVMRVRKQFLASICQTSMSEPIMILRSALPNLICAECNSSKEPLDIYIYHDPVRHTFITRSYKKLRFVTENAISSGIDGLSKQFEIMIESKFTGTSDTHSSNMSVVCSKDSAANILKAIISFTSSKRCQS